MFVGMEAPAHLGTVAHQGGFTSARLPEQQIGLPPAVIGELPFVVGDGILPVLFPDGNGDVVIVGHCFFAPVF